MKRIKLKFNYGNEFRIFDATLAIVDINQNSGFVLALSPLEVERYIFLAPGNYLAQMIYDLPKTAGIGKQTCLWERPFNSEKIERININFAKPTATIAGFDKSELIELEEMLKKSLGGRINPRTDQILATNTVKSLPGASLEERVVIDKNGKVEYEFSFQEQEVYDYLSPEDLGAGAELSTNQPTPMVAAIAPPERPSLRPYITQTLNYGHWNINLHGLNVTIGATLHSYRNIRTTAYLRPRNELFQRLAGFIEESMAVARRINDVVTQ
ncbi:MAG: hypothetical protein AB1489_07690 [Acidobacteriota bacterium]